MEGIDFPYTWNNFDNIIFIIEIFNLSIIIETERISSIHRPRTRVKQIGYMILMRVRI